MYSMIRWRRERYDHCMQVTTLNLQVFARQAQPSRGPISEYYRETKARQRLDAAVQGHHYTYKNCDPGRVGLYGVGEQSGRGKPKCGLCEEQFDEDIVPVPDGHCRACQVMMITRDNQSKLTKHGGHSGAGGGDDTRHQAAPNEDRSRCAQAYAQDRVAGTYAG